MDPLLPDPLALSKIKEEVGLDPYRDLASQVLPTTIPGALKWAEFIAMRNGVFSEALRRICAYCTTDIDILSNPDGSLTTDKERRTRYLNIFGPEMLNLSEKTMHFARCLLTYANVFVSVHIDFTRYLSCPHCGFETPFEQAYDNPAYKFQWKDFNFNMYCPKCHKMGDWVVNDRFSKRPEDLFIKFWNVHDIRLVYSPFTERSDIVYRIPGREKTLIQNGARQVLKDTPMALINAVKDNTDFLFDKDCIRHFKEPTLCGIRSEGWGIPRTVANFRETWYWQTIHRFNEIIATQFLVPLRILSPPPGGDKGGFTDQQLGVGLGNFKRNVQRMINDHRRDPGMIAISPAPIQYQTLSGDANQFMPREQMEYALSTLLSSIGIPVEMYQGTMQLNVAPMALRQFETTWGWLISAENQFANFVAKRAAILLNDTPVKVQFQRITHADDMNRQYAKMQLMSNGLISKTTGLASVGIDQQEEARKMMEEDRDMAELQQKMQEDMENEQMFQQVIPTGQQRVIQRIQEQQMMAQQGGGMPQGEMGMPAPPAGGGQPMQPGAMPSMGGMASPIDQMIAQWQTMPTTTVQDMDQKAETIAQQIAAMGPGPERERTLRKLKQQDPTIHPFVKAKLEQMDREMEYQGRQMMMQQQQQGGM